MNSRAGLSLFELLLALALLAFVAAGLAAAFGLGVRLNDRTAALSDDASEIALRLRLAWYQNGEHHGHDREGDQDFEQ
jgi:type II secretory pathway pseudopilin PulG